MDFVQDNRIPPHGSYATTQKKKTQTFWRTTLCQEKLLSNLL